MNTYLIRVTHKSRLGHLTTADIPVEAKSEAIAVREMQDRHPTSKVQSLGEMIDVKSEPSLQSIFKRALTY